MASLRDIGYDTPAAIADLVDNSIDADARTVDVTVGCAGEESWIRISDDGIGMTPRELDEAMRYGSRRDYRGDALGHFGLGLKTASLSQCRRLTVAARSTPRARIEIRRWDLDHVTATDAWALERLTPRECPARLLDPLIGISGTVVMWERLDRVLGYSRPDGSAAMAGLERVAAEISEHLSMVFHRFLGADAGRGRARIRMSMDAVTLTAWDPFARGEPATQSLQPQSLAINHQGAKHRVRISPYILPNQIRFSSPEAHARAAGPKRWNRQQGLYVYRHDRMIQSGGWNRLRTLDEHTKLARISLDIPRGADGAFQTNVSKMNIILPESLRGDLRAVISGVVIRAQDVYRQRIEVLEGGAAGDADPKATSIDPERTLGGRLADDWPMIAAVLERELGDQPELLRRVLVALANARSGDSSRSQLSVRPAD
jgi:hypothetical protein